MEIQWEDQFTCLGDSSREMEVFPIWFADVCGTPSARVIKKRDLRKTIQKMLDINPVPYLLDVIVPC